MGTLPPVSTSIFIGGFLTPSLLYLVAPLEDEFPKGTPHHTKIREGGSGLFWKQKPDAGCDTKHP